MKNAFSNKVLVSLLVVMFPILLFAGQMEFRYRQANEYFPNPRGVLGENNISPSEVVGENNRIIVQNVQTPEQEIYTNSLQSQESNESQNNTFAPDSPAVPESSVTVSFYASSALPLNNIQFSVIFEDGSQTSWEVFKPAEGGFGEIESSEFYTSNLYIFNKKINRVSFLPETSEIKINFLNSSPQTLSRSSIIDYERSYKERLFNALGFNIVTREEWGAPTESEWYPNIAQVNRVVIHHTATTVDYYNSEENVRLIYEFHKIRCSNNIGTYPQNCPIEETWSDIGYNYLIAPNGNLYEGRSGGNGVIAAHAPPNSGSIGIGILGDYSWSTPSPQALETLKRLLGSLSLINDFELSWETSVFAHRHINNTACPGDAFFNILPGIVSNAQNIKSQLTTALKANLRTKNLFEQEAYVSTELFTEIILNKRGLDYLMYQKLQTLFGGVEEIKESEELFFYNIPQTLRNQFLTEIFTALPETSATPNLIFPQIY